MWLFLAVVWLAVTAMVSVLIRTVFCRPIERQGLLVSLIAFFASGVAFDKIRTPAWATLIAFFLVSLSPAFALNFSIVYLLRRFHSWLIAILVAGLFGLCTGYLDAWSAHEQPNEGWYALFGSPGELGDAITMYRVWRGDEWQMGEVWYHRHEAALWNALAWIAIGILGAIPLYFATRPYQEGNASDSSPGNQDCVTPPA